MPLKGVPRPNLLLFCSAAFFVIAALIALVGLVFSGPWSDALRDYLTAHLAAFALLSMALFGLLFTLLISRGPSDHKGMLSVTCVDHRTNGAEALYRRATEWVRSAEREVSILQSPVPVAPPPNAPPLLSGDFYDAIIEQTRRGVRYSHVFQINGPNELAGVLEDAALAGHVELAFVRRAAGSDTAVANIRLKWARTSFGDTLVFIDDARLIWHLHEKASDGKSVLAGMMFMEDPEGDVLATVRRIYDRLDGQATLLLEDPMRSARPSSGNKHPSSTTPPVLDWRRP